MRVDTNRGIVNVKSRKSLYSYVAEPLVSIRRSVYPGRQGNNELTVEQLKALFRELELRAYTAQFMLKSLERRQNDPVE